MIIKNFHKIIVLGQTGDGKSTFCNYILGEEKCRVDDDAERVTTEIKAYVSEKEKNKDIIMIDTPGLSDTKGEDQKIIDDIRKAIKDDHCDGIKSIIIMHNFNVPRLSAESKRELMIFSKLFPIPDFWQHVGIVFSFAYEDMKQFEQMKEAKLKKFMPDLTKTIEKIIIDNGNKIKMPGNIQCFFTDCKQIIPNNRTDNQVDELINWTRDLNYLDIDKNDLNGKVFANCKDRKHIGDKNTTKEDKEDENTIKLTVEFYRQYKILDFNDQWSGEYAEDKPYKVEIYYFITEKGFDEITDSINLDETKKTIIKTKKFWSKTNKCDKNKKIIDEGEKKYYNTFTGANTADKILKDKEPADTRQRTVEKKDEINFESDSDLQKYYNNLGKMSVGGKIVFIGFNVLHFISGLGHLVTWIISKLQKKRRWKQVITYKKTILEKHIIKVDEFKNEYDRGWEYVKDIETFPPEYSKPIQI